MSTHAHGPKTDPNEGNRVAARRNQFANHNFPVTFQTYRLLHGKTHIGMFSKVKWLTAGGTPEQISLILASTTEGIIWEPPVYYIPVTQTFRDEFNLRERRIRLMNPRMSRVLNQSGGLALRPPYSIGNPLPSSKPLFLR